MPMPAPPHPAMNRLPSELRRLYVPQPDADQGRAPEELCLIDSGGRVRAMVLELARPADWAALSKLWQGVQADLELPAPAIAVSGQDGFQLWFSLAEPVPAARAMVFLESLRVRYLGDIKAQRVALMPVADAASTLQARHAKLVPAQQANSGHWSAFVAPDLAPVFNDEPWLDIPPSPEGQSELLSRLKSIPLADFRRALERLMPAPVRGPFQEVSGAAEVVIGCLDPKRFLYSVMNDNTVALALRIEAAKALLPYTDDPRPH
jgi:hypothetical protein